MVILLGEHMKTLSLITHGIIISCQCYLSENLFQCDPDGHTYVLFDSITNFRRTTTALCYADQALRKTDGRKFLHQSTAGGRLCVLWKYGSTAWRNLSDLKELYPLETAEYALSQSLKCDPVFNWWVPFVLNNRVRIIYLVKKRSARYLKCN